MSKCVVCGAYSAKMFLPDGNPACNRCFYAEDTHRKEDTSSKQAITGGYAAIAIGLLGIVFCVLIGAKKLAIVPGLLFTGGIAGIRHGKATQRRLAAKQSLEPFG